jgi:hypothetical protein
MSLVGKYKDVPVTNRFGVGNFTYKCVLDTEQTGIIKIEIFANTVEAAINIAVQQFGALVSYSYVSSDIISLILAPYSDGTCLLYI